MKPFGFTDMWGYVAYGSPGLWDIRVVTVRGGQPGTASASVAGFSRRRRYARGERRGDSVCGAARRRGTWSCAVGRCGVPCCAVWGSWSKGSPWPRPTCLFPRAPCPSATSPTKDVNLIPNFVYLVVTNKAWKRKCSLAVWLHAGLVWFSTFTNKTKYWYYHRNLLLFSLLSIFGKTREYLVAPKNSNIMCG